MHILVWGPKNPKAKMGVLNMENRGTRGVITTRALSCTVVEQETFQPLQKLVQLINNVKYDKRAAQRRVDCSKGLGVHIPLTGASLVANSTVE